MTTARAATTLPRGTVTTSPRGAATGLLSCSQRASAPRIRVSTAPARPSTVAPGFSPRSAAIDAATFRARSSSSPGPASGGVNGSASARWQALHSP